MQKHSARSVSTIAAMAVAAVMLTATIGGKGAMAMDDGPPLSTVTVELGLMQNPEGAAYDACMALDAWTVQGLVVTIQLSMHAMAKTEMPVTRADKSTFVAEIGAQCGPNCWARIAAVVRKNYPANWALIQGVARCLAERVGEANAPTAEMLAASTSALELYAALDMSRWANAVVPAMNAMYTELSIPLSGDMDAEPDPRTVVNVAYDGAVTVDICMPYAGLRGYVAHAAGTYLETMECDAGKVGMRFIIRATKKTPSIENLIDAYLESSAAPASTGRSSAPTAKTISMPDGKDVAVSFDTKTARRVADTISVLTRDSAMCTEIMACAADGTVHSARNTDWGLGKEFIGYMRNASADVLFARPHRVPAFLRPLFGLNSFRKLSTVPIVDGVNYAVGADYATGMNTINSYGRMPPEVMLALMEADLHAQWRRSPIPHPAPNALAMQWVMEHAPSYRTALRLIEGNLNVFPHFFAINSRRDGAIFQTDPFHVDGTRTMHVNCRSETDWIQTAPNFVDRAHAYLHGPTEVLRWTYLEQEKGNRAAYATEAAAHARMDEVLDLPHINGVWTVFRAHPDPRSGELGATIMNSHYETDDVRVEELPLLNCLYGKCECYNALVADPTATCESLIGVACKGCADCGIGCDV